MAGIKHLIWGFIKDDSLSEAHLITVCADIGEAYLKIHRKEQYIVQSLGITLRDFAFDGIAELFTENGKVLKGFFDPLSLKTMDEAAVFINLRKLVFGQMNDHIFASYKQVDPSLSKIIRNIKRGVKYGRIDQLRIGSNPRFIEHEELNKGQPCIPHHLLIHRYIPNTVRPQNMTEALLCLRDFFEMHPQYQARISILSFAFLLRDYYAMQLEEVIEFNNTSISEMYQEELVKIIKKAVKHIRLSLYAGYVVYHQKMEEHMYALYFMVVEKILLNEYFLEEREHTYYEFFRSIHGEITKKEYRDQHRQYLEYFVKKTRQRLIDVLKAEIKSAEQ